MKDIEKQKRVYKINGLNFDDFAGFIEECNRSFILASDGNWSGNLDAFNDYLSWPDGPYVLRWANVEKSRSELGYAAMALWLSGLLETCHPTNRRSVKKRLKAAKQSKGQTLFDMLVEIIEENSDWVTLDLRL